MLISARRQIWGLNIVLLITAAWIYRPIRSWIDQVVVTQCIHPNMSAQEIHFHPNRLASGLSVAEVRQFNWSSSYNDRQFGISAEQAWIVIENRDLIEKQFTVPKALLRHSKLYLEQWSENEKLADSRPTAFPSTSLWQQQIDKRFGGVEWNDLKQHFDGVLKLNEFADLCNTKIEAWVAGSASIAEEVRQLANVQSSPNNPLRDGADHRQKLDQIQVLVDREAKLRDQFSTLDETLQAKLKEIEAEYENHTSLAKLKAADHRQALRQQVAEGWIKDTASKIFERFSKCVEVADLLSHVSTYRAGYQADENYRVPGKPVFALQNALASGSFASGQQKFPFQMQSHCTSTPLNLFGTVARNGFRFKFDVDPYTIMVSACNRFHQQQMVDLQVQFQPLNQPTVDSPSSNPEIVQTGSAQWVISSDGRTITGELSIDQYLAPFFAQDQPRLTPGLAAALDSNQTSSPSEIVLQLEGTWNAPIWAFTGQQIPDWLNAVIDQQLEQQQRENEQQLVAMLDRHVAIQVDQLAVLLNERLDAAQQQTEGFARELATARENLHRFVNSGETTEFARSGDEELKR